MRRRENKSKAYIGLFIVAVMILSTFGFIVGFNQNTAQDYSYNGFEFEQQGNHWVVEAETPFGTKEFTFLLHPLSLSVDVPTTIPEAIKQTPTIIFTFDPNVTGIEYVDAARFELSQYFISNLGKNIRHTVTQNTTQYSFPIETCTQTPNTVYIIFEESDQSNASLSDNCITLAASSPQDYIEYAEKIIYMMVGII